VRGVSSPSSPSSPSPRRRRRRRDNVAASEPLAEEPVVRGLERAITIDLPPPSRSMSSILPPSLFRVPRSSHGWAVCEGLIKKMICIWVKISVVTDKSRDAAGLESVRPGLDWPMTARDRPGLGAAGPITAEQPRGVGQGSVAGEQGRTSRNRRPALLRERRC